MKTRREFGCLIKRHGIWHVRWDYDGVQHQKSTGCERKCDAEDVAKAIIAPFLAQRREDVAAALAARVERAGRAADEATPALKIADLWDAYERSPSRPDTGAATMRMYRFQVGRFVRWAGMAAPQCREVRQITPAIAGRFLGDIRDAMSANTYNKHIVLLRRVWRCVRDEARWTENPWDAAQTRPGDARRRRMLSAEEIESLVDAAKGEWRTLILIGAYSGLRLGDAARLAAEDIRDGRIVIAPRKTRRKSGAEVRIPIHPRLAKALTETGVASGPFLPGIAKRYGRDCGNVSRAITRIFRRAGIPTTETEAETGRKVVVAGFHSLRHSFVSRLADSGAPLTLVQALAGHSTPTMTAHYYHADDEKAAAAVAALDGGMDAAARKAKIAKLEAELAMLKSMQRSRPGKTGK